jgi:hypothetical protein
VRPPINIRKNINNPKLRWEPAAAHGLFGKLLGTPTIVPARRTPRLPAGDRFAQRAGDNKLQVLLKAINEKISQRMK